MSVLPLWKVTEEDKGTRRNCEGFTRGVQVS